jgi:hypothetical protein
VSAASSPRVPTREGRLARRYGLLGGAVAMLATQLPWPALSTVGSIAGFLLLGLGIYYHLVNPEPSGVVPDDA